MIAIVNNKTKQFVCLSLLILSLAFSFTNVFAQGNVVTGKVTTSTGEPLAGASVVVKGSRTGTSTDASGNFSLNVTNPNATLVISSAGYELQEICLNGRSSVDLA